MTTPQPEGETARIMWAQPADPTSKLNDHLQARLDFYRSSIQLTSFRDGAPDRVWPVSAHDLAQAITANVRTHSGILPESALWKTLTPAGPSSIALWVPPQTRRVALTVEYNKPTRRFHLPMPGMVFICSPHQPPRIYATKSRPASEDASLYHCPVFNTFENGNTCQGTQDYPEDITEMPNAFFTSWFSMHGNSQKRSHKHPSSLLSLWEELDGQQEYPLDDLVYWGRVKEVMEQA